MCGGISVKRKTGTNQKISLGILAAAFLGLTAIGIYQVAVRQDFSAQTLVPLLLSLCTLCTAAGTILAGRKRPAHRFYSKQYQHILRGAFAQDWYSRKRLYRALDFFNGNREEKAARIFKKLIAKCRAEEDFTAVYTFLGLCLEDLDCTEEAIEAYTKAVQYRGGVSTAWSNMGFLYARHGDSGKAVECYQQAITMDNGNAYAYNNLASIYLQSGRLDDCITAANQALERKSNLFQAYSALAIAYKMKGDREAAERYASLYVLNGGDSRDIRATLDTVGGSVPVRPIPTANTIRQWQADTYRPVLHLSLVRCSPGLTECKVGGIPYLPRDMDWPRDSSGRPLQLLIQIDCRLCACLPDFPKQGLLQFFIAPGGSYGLNFEDQTRQDGFRVIYHSWIDSSVTEREVSLRMPFHGEEDFPVKGVYGLDFKQGQEPISRGDYRLERIMEEKKASCGVELMDWEDVLENWPDGSGHKMGGYPAFTQEDPRNMTGLERFDTLLIQLDSQWGQEIDIMWGDSGVGQFFINRDKLLDLDFSDILYNWDCL